MKAAAFEYLKAGDVAGAVKALAGAAGEAKALGGGQSLGPMLNLRLTRPKLLVDVSRLDAMRAIEDKGAAWRFGGAVTHSAILYGAAAHELCLTHLFCQGAPEFSRHDATNRKPLAHEARQCHFPTVTNLSNQLTVWNKYIL